MPSNVEIIPALNRLAGIFFFFKLLKTTTTTQRHIRHSNYMCLNEDTAQSAQADLMTHFFSFHLTVRFSILVYSTRLCI